MGFVGGVEAGYGWGMDDDVVAEIAGLTKTYRGGVRAEGVRALRGVSFSAGRGEVFGLLGPNGAGKTTIIKSMLGIIRPTSGTAKLFGNPAGSLRSAARVGYLPESLRIDSHHTARTALSFYGRLSRLPGEVIRRRREELIDLVGLKGRDRESVRRFSKGMYQRLGLAQALMHDPDLLILDEPTDGLDPVGRNEVRGVIERLREAGKTIFVNSHILQEVELVCDRVAVLARGELKAIGTIDDLRRQWSVGQPGRMIVEIETVDGDAEATVSRSYDLADQSELDAEVDRLRRGGASIVAIRPRHVTLEQAFMSLVGEAEQ